MEVGAFSRLEQKVEELLNQLLALREENAELHNALNERESRIAELSQRAEGLESERDEVRGRIERLVEKLESY
jgi:cell division protein ZapB